MTPKTHPIATLQDADLTLAMALPPMLRSNPDIWVAGGAVVRALRGLPLPHPGVDLDMLAPTEAYLALRYLLKSDKNNTHVRGRGHKDDPLRAEDPLSEGPDGLFGRAALFATPTRKVDLIEAIGEGHDAVVRALAQFDIRACAVAWNPELGLIFHPGAERDIRLGRVTVMETKPTTEARIGKYHTLFAQSTALALGGTS